MATKPTRLPKQIFVVSKNAKEYEYPIAGDWTTKIELSHNFGFLHPHEPQLKTDATRKKTQIDWAYRGASTYLLGDQWWIKGRDYNYTTRSYEDYDHPLDPQYAPRVWDNVPLTGFKIIDTVNRYRGNKLFKILDPRGVEFEITVACLFTLLMAGEVRHGEILTPCLWKANKNLIVAE